MLEGVPPLLLLTENPNIQMKKYRKNIVQRKKQKKV